MNPPFVFRMATGHLVISNASAKLRRDMMRALRDISTGGSGYDDTIAIKTRRNTIHLLADMGLVYNVNPFKLALTAEGKEVIS